MMVVGKLWRVLFATVLTQCVHPVSGGILTGSYRGSETWIYLDRFVFQPSSAESRGRLQVTLDFPMKDWESPALMLFYKGGEETGVQKEFGLWERAYNTDLLCEEKAKIAKQTGGIYIPLPGGRQVTKFRDRNGMERWSVNVEANMETSRARWLFITLGNCRPDCGEPFCSNSLDVNYVLNMTNGGGSSMYFSADETWFLEISIAFAVFYSLVFLFALYTRHLLLQEKKYHHSVKLLVWSITFSFISSILLAAYYSQYSSSGVSAPGTEFAGVFFSLFAEFSLLLMTILVAKGWTIVRRKISAPGRVRIAAYMTLYVVVSLACWVYFKSFVDPAAIVYIYSTVPGTLLILLRTFAFCWFSYAVYVTLRKYRQKRAFYKKYWFFVGAWILTLPVLAAINSAVDAWARSKLFHLLSILATFICQTALIVMYNPKGVCGLNQSFPFHVTTNNFIRNDSKSDTQTSSFQGSNTFDEAHLLRAFQISSQMRHSIVMLQSYVHDLHSFLDSIRQKIKPAGIQQVDLEAGGKPLLQQQPAVPQRTKSSEDGADALISIVKKAEKKKSSSSSLENDPSSSTTTPATVLTSQAQEGALNQQNTVQETGEDEKILRRKQSSSSSSKPRKPRAKPKKPKSEKKVVEPDNDDDL